MKNQKGTRRLAIFTFILVIAVVAGVVSVFNFYKEKIDKKVASYTNQYLSDVMDESAERIAVKINENFNALEVLAKFVEEYEDIVCDDVKKMLDGQLDITLANTYNVINRDGQSIYPIENKKEYLESDHIVSAFQKKKAISDIVTSEDGVTQEIKFAVPIYHGQDVVGVFEFAYNLETFAELMGDSVMDRKADTFIIQTDGTFVSRPETVTGGGNIFSMLENIMVDEATTIKNFRKSIENEETGTLVIGEDKYKRYICYNQIPENNWYVVTIMSANVIESNIYDVSELAGELGTAIILIFSVLILYIVIVYVKTIMNTRLNYHRYRIVAEHSNNIIFEYNCKNNTAFHNSKWEPKFGYKPVEKNYIENMIKGDIIVPEDVEKFESMFEELRQGKKIVEKELRIYDKDKNPIWMVMKASGIRKHGTVKKIIGRYIDIDKSKKEIEYFKEQARIDTSTGLYNKEATEYMLEEYVSSLKSSNEKGAFLFIDIDNFKPVTDSYGHMFADHLLNVVAKIIKDNTNENDLTGHLGGDEFAVVLKRIKSEEEVLECANNIINKVAELEFKHHKQVKITVSIGIVLLPESGNTTRKIMKVAEKAMYSAKAEGKGRAFITK